MKHLAAVNADVITTGNPGCLIQIGIGARQHGMTAAVVHPIELLHRAYLASPAKHGSLR
jgi:glycolate oxidase iron-sulfur subunit